MTLPRDEARFLAGIARDERKVLREIFLLAAELVADGSEEFSCNAISHTVRDHSCPLDGYRLRKAYEGLYKHLDLGTPPSDSLAWQISVAHGAKVGPPDRKAAREHRIFMLLLARELVRTGDFE